MGVSKTFAPGRKGGLVAQTDASTRHVTQRDRRLPSLTKQVVDEIVGVGGDGKIGLRQRTKKIVVVKDGVVVVLQVGDTNQFLHQCDQIQLGHGRDVVLQFGTVPGEVLLNGVGRPGWVFEITHCLPVVCPAGALL